MNPKIIDVEFDGHPFGISVRIETQNVVADVDPASIAAEKGVVVGSKV